MKKDINFITTSSKAKAAVTALINMNNAVGFAIHVGVEQDEAFLTTIQQAHYYATQTKIDINNIDAKLHNVITILLMEAKLANDHFCKGINNHLIYKLMLTANQQATAQLMSLD